MRVAAREEVKNGAAFTHANAEAAELRLRTGAADRTMQHGSPEGLQTGCATAIPPQPSCVIS